MNSFLFCGFRRGGSSIAFEVLEKLFLSSGYRTLDVVSKYFNTGVPIEDIHHQPLANAAQENDLLGVFRAYIVSLEKLIDAGCRPILIIRDPRDCLLSWRYAQYLHVNTPLPAEIRNFSNDSVDDFYDPDFIDNCFRLYRLVDSSGGLIFRYEDFVLDPAKTLHEIIIFSNLEFRPDAVDTALLHATFVNLVADEHQHNRLGSPYNFLTTANPKILASANEILGDLIVELKYPLEYEKFSEQVFYRLASRDSLKRYILGLAKENAYRIEDIAALRACVENILSDLQELKFENHLRITQIATILKNQVF